MPIVIAVVAIGMCIGVFFLRQQAILPLVAPWLCISDALTAVGLMYCLWGIVLVAINKGALDALFYIFHNYAAYLKKGERVETEDYFDYCKKRVLGFINLVSN